jgi:hypothetical protein
MATIAEIRDLIEAEGGALELGTMQQQSDRMHLLYASVFGPLNADGLSRSYEQKKLTVFDIGTQEELAYFVGTAPVLLAPAPEPEPQPVPVGTDEDITYAVFVAAGTKSLKVRITHEADGALVSAWIESEPGVFEERLYFVVEDPDTKGLIAYQRKQG